MNSFNEYAVKDASFWQKFLNFDQFITGSVIKIIYLIGAILIGFATIGGSLMYLGTFLVALTNFSLGGILIALLFFAVNLIVGAFLLFLLRVYCELIMVIFKINENLQTLRDKNH